MPVNWLEYRRVGSGMMHYISDCVTWVFDLKFLRSNRLDLVCLMECYVREVWFNSIFLAVYITVCL